MRIQLSADQAVPGCCDRIQRSRQHEDERAVGDAGQTSALQCARADALEGQHPEQFAKAVDCFVQQGGDGLRCAISAGQPGTAAADHHVDIGIGDPAAQFRSDPIAVIGAESSLFEPMAGGFQAVLQVITAGVIGEGTRVGDGEQGDGKAQGTAVQSPDARTASVEKARVLRVLLFASLRERAGWEERTLPLPSESPTARQVWEGLHLGPLLGISIAVNQQLVDADQRLKAGDELAFLPPFTGG